MLSPPPGRPTRNGGTPNKVAILDSLKWISSINAMSFGLVATGSHSTPPNSTAGSPTPDWRAATQSAFSWAACVASYESACFRIDGGYVDATVVAYLVKTWLAVTRAPPASNGPTPCA